MSKFIVPGISCDRSTRVFACAASLTELKEELKLKLKLPLAQYEVFQDSDGTRIDDDDIFRMLAEEAKGMKTQLGVMLLSDSQSWTDPSILCAQTPTSSRMSHSSSREALNDDSDSLGSSNTSDSDQTTTRNQSTPRRQPMSAFPMTEVCDCLDDVLEQMNSETPPTNIAALKKRAIREACHNAGRYMLKKLRDYRKVTARALAKHIIDFEDGRYSKIFRIVVGGSVSDAGYKSFAQCIYACVNHNKGPENTGRRGRGSLSSRSAEEDEDDSGLLPPPPSKQDLYGCVAYEVPLPFGESEASQEAKRVVALGLANPTCQEAFTLMEATYATQRLDINRSKPMKVRLPSVLLRWPLLRHKSHFISHAQTLLGKSVEGVFTNNLSNHWKNIFDYLRQFCEIEARKETVPGKVLAMQDLIESALAMGISNRSVEARCIATFPLIALHMGEKLDKLFVVLPDTATDEAVCSAGLQLGGYPLLVIRGKSIFEHQKCDVVLVGKELINVTDPIEGFLVLLLSYFVFTCLYQPANHSSLEFYQRFFLEVNPSSGDKRAVRKRSIDGVDSKVKKLAEQLASHTCHWALN